MKNVTVNVQTGDQLSLGGLYHYSTDHFEDMGWHASAAVAQAVESLIDLFDRDTQHKEGVMVVTITVIRG